MKDNETLQLQDILSKYSEEKQYKIEGVIIGEVDVTGRKLYEQMFIINKDNQLMSLNVKINSDNEIVGLSMQKNIKLPSSEILDLKSTIFKYKFFTPNKNQFINIANDISKQTEFGIFTIKNPWKLTESFDETNLSNFKIFFDNLQKNSLDINR